MNIECATKVSPNCTGSFTREKRRGRPFVSCEACREVKKVAVTTRTTAANPINAETQERTCGCGTTFKVKPGRGRKAEKCDECRAAGTVYRRTDDGMLEAIQADQLKREDNERKREAGETRALLLHMDMQKLFKRRGLSMAGH
jgi:hypothetical protein